MNTDEDCFFSQDGRVFGYWFVNDERGKFGITNYELRSGEWEGGRWEMDPSTFAQGKSRKMEEGLSRLKCLGVSPLKQVYQCKRKTVYKFTILFLRVHRLKTSL